MNVVFDTNIYVSGFTRPTGRANLALARIALEIDTLFICPPIVDELTRVLEDKFSRDREELARVQDWIARNSTTVTPAETLHILADEPDNRILECAVAASADLIVTGDRAMLALELIENTRIVSLGTYLETVDNSLTDC